MPLKFLRRGDLVGSNRHVRSDVYETVRFLLAEDGMGLTITDITLQPNIEAIYGYDRHIEIAYCIEGSALITDHATMESVPIAEGTLWIAEKGDRFTFRADTPTRLICVFTPAFEGGETGFAGDQ